MRYLSLTFFLLLLAPAMATAQLVHINPGGDTSRTLSLEGYADVYFGFDFNQPDEAVRPYFVSYSRHNEFNINLAYLSLKYSSPRARATLTPGFGTYMNANYNAERVTLRNIVEANIGVKPWANKNIWLDAGVLPSPYTNETAVAYDQIMYTRSFAPEYVPYYITGARLSLPLHQKLNLYLYLLNGWQVIEDVNSPLAFGSQLEYRPDGHWLINWNTYIGNEESKMNPRLRTRYFSDVYATYSSSRWTLATCIYGGIQELNDPEKKKGYWGQGNIAAKYALNAQQAVNARIEYFSDADGIMIQSVTGQDHFGTTSASLGFQQNIGGNVQFRLEGRYFRSNKEHYYDGDGQPTDQSLLLIGGLVARF